MRIVGKRQSTALPSLSSAHVSLVRLSLLSLMLAACGAAPPKPGPAPREPPPAAAARGAASQGGAVPVAGTHYRIDPERSELRVLVYRAGAMASLGHNHVIRTQGLQGWATFDGNASAAAFALTVPVANFVIDDPERRREEGADFAEEVTDDARAGTARNMLGPAVLNAADFPALTIRSVAVSPGSGSLRARVALEVAGHASTLEVPFVLETPPHRLVAHGEVDLRQSSLGLTPFSVFLGALKVQDELKVKFNFVAVRDGL